MEGHLRHLQALISLEGKKVLDLGSGRGDFIITAKKNNIDVVGVELNSTYIEETKRKAQKENLQIEVFQGVGEKLPFTNNTFDFINMSEVIEHVKDPEKVLSEVYRTLKPDGSVYISVPNRFGLKDPHYHLYFVNWLPRSFSDFYISLFKKKKQDDSSAGLQNLKEMHYYRFQDAKKLFEKLGFSVTDIRSLRIKKEYKNGFQYLLQFIYLIIRAFYFDTFHILLNRN